MGSARVSKKGRAGFATVLFVGGIALGLAVGAPGALGSFDPAAPAPPATGQLQRALLDLTGATDDSVLVVPAHLPAPGPTSGIGPGSHLLITMAGGTYGCTANFVWNGTNGKRYLGAAGHCFLPEGKTATHGPGKDYNPALTTVKVCVSNCNFGGETGFIITGTLVSLGPVAYARQTQSGVDIGNDFGIVTIPTSLYGQIRTSMPVWGGAPTTGNIGLGSIVCHYGNGVAVGETWPTMARAGVGIGTNTAGGYWQADTAAAPGDSGSAVNVCGQDSGGVHGKQAAGILTHLAVGAGLVVGTTVAKAKTMATQASLTINVSPGA